MLSAAKHLAADCDRPFAEFTLERSEGLKVTWCDYSNCQGLFFTIEPCLLIKSIYTIAEVRNKYSTASVKLPGPKWLEASYQYFHHDLLFLCIRYIIMPLFGRLGHRAGV